MNGLDRNGYAPSIMQSNTSYCFICGRTDRKLDRHEVFGAANRQKSKALGLWVALCHRPCHLDGVHKNAADALILKEEAQRVAMQRYEWTKEDFIKQIGKSYVED